MGLTISRQRVINYWIRRHRDPQELAQWVIDILDMTKANQDLEISRIAKLTRERLDLELESYNEAVATKTADRDFFLGEE